MEDIPTIAFMGVRISWDILERKRLLALLVSSAARKASSRTAFCLVSSAILCSDASCTCFMGVSNIHNVRMESKGVWVVVRWFGSCEGFNLSKASLSRPVIIHAISSAYKMCGRPLLSSSVKRYPVFLLL